MQFAPEAQILILNSVILALAYLGIYPTLEQKTLNRIMTIDVVLSVLALSVAGALFWGTGVTFSLMLFKTNWAVFTIVTLFVMEVPLFLRFARKHGINLFDDDAP
jgi:predicted membrane-bound spermidine synthase